MSDRTTYELTQEFLKPFQPFVSLLRDTRWQWFDFHLKQTCDFVPDPGQEEMEKKVFCTREGWRHFIRGGSWHGVLGVILAARTLLVWQNLWVASSQWAREVSPSQLVTLPMGEMTAEAAFSTLGVSNLLATEQVLRPYEKVLAQVRPLLVKLNENTVRFNGIPANSLATAVIESTFRVCSRAKGAIQLAWDLRNKVGTKDTTGQLLREWTWFRDNVPKPASADELAECYAELEKEYDRAKELSILSMAKERYFLSGAHLLTPKPREYLHTGPSEPATPPHPSPTTETMAGKTAVHHKKNEARDKWIYKQCCKVIPHDEIVAELKKLALKRQWRIVSTKQRIQQIGNEYADAHPPLERPPSRRNL